MEEIAWKGGAQVGGGERSPVKAETVDEDRKGMPPFLVLGDY